MESRPRDHRAEYEAHALSRSRADNHPLSAPTPSSPRAKQVVTENSEINEFSDPLRATDSNAAVVHNGKSDAQSARAVGLSGEAIGHVPSKEWSSFKRLLMQKFPVSKMISVSSMPDVIVKTSGNASEKSSRNTHLEEADDLQKISDKDAKFVTRQEYVSRLHELKDEIAQAWNAEDRVTALKLAIKVVTLLTDTSVLEFYPTLFVLATDVMDMLGNMVWQRIKRRAEFSEDGTVLCSLPENFKAVDICSEAKETCNNWFCKIGSIRELLPRIYLELAIFPCWLFLLDEPLGTLQRLVMMTRGIADPLAATYCRLYMVHCARKLPISDTGYLVTCINDIKILLMRFLAEDIPYRHFTDKNSLLVSLMEPAIEYIMKCIFENVSQRQAVDVLVDLGLGRNELDLFGDLPCLSVVLHRLLNELPLDVVSSNAVGIIQMIKCSIDQSFDQCLNYRLLGFRLSECRYHMGNVNSLVDEIIKVLSDYGRLDEYLKIVEPYLDIILQNQMDGYLNLILDGISKRACGKEIVEDELGSLQSILLKLLSHFKDLDTIFSLDHFLEILDAMSGRTRSVVSLHILSMATRDTCIHDPSTVQLLFGICRSLHDDIDWPNMKDDDNQQPVRLISRFVQMVDYGAEIEQHLTFLVESRSAFGSINELKETLVHSSNCLATKALKDGKQLAFIKSCIAFSEVTVPSVSAQVRQLYLYLETAEVALLAGLVSHSDGLIVSAIQILESLEFTDGSISPIDADGILSSIQKLCSLLVMNPGNFDQSFAKFPKSILSLIYSRSWMTQRMKTRIFCALVLLFATLSQNKLPYHASYLEMLGNDSLFFSDSSYVHELVALSNSVLENIVSSIERETSNAARGSMALEACNCIASSFKVSHDILQVCQKLIDTARLCLSDNDKYLQSTIKYLDEQLPTSAMVLSAAM